MVGSAIALDLAKEHNVTITDQNESALNKVISKNNSIKAVALNVRNETKLKELIIPFDLVVCAVPGFLGYTILRTIIDAGKNVVDISFFPENALELDALAKRKNVTAIVDCGVAPGLDNIILGHYNEQIVITGFECLVGGLPKIKKWPFNYKAPFSPVDVIEEYTREARFVENGKIVVKEALSDIELHEFEKIGTLESFNSDGLRSLIYTLPHIPNMKEKTLRYPGHRELIRALKESGFLNKQKIEINGLEISPLEFTSKILFDEWKLGDREPEFTIMRITIKGTDKKGGTQTIVYEIYDEYDEVTQTSSMSRTTGYTACSAVNLILNGMFTGKGVFPPELVGKDENCFDFVLKYLKQRNINVRKMS